MNKRERRFSVLCIGALLAGSGCSAPRRHASPPIVRTDRSSPTQPSDTRPPEDPSLLDPTVLDKVKNATVLIGDFEHGVLTATGSGFVVGDGKKIVTNKHVVTGTGDAADTLKVVFFSGTPKARIVQVPASAITLYGTLGRGNRDYHKEDIAYATIPTKVAEPLEVVEDPAIQETMPVWALGFPRGIGILSDQDMPSVTVHSLRIERIERAKNAVTLLQLSGSPTYGNSGGPVVDRQGRVIGVIEAKDVEAPILFAIPSVRVNKMLAGSGPSGTTIAEEFKAPLKGAFSGIAKPQPAWGSGDGGPRQTYGSVLNGRDIAAGDLQGLSSVQLTILRNEPFARRGYIFRRAQLRTAFGAFRWYRPRTHNLAAVQRLLTARETRNVTFIKAYQRENGLDY